MLKIISILSILFSTAVFSQQAIMPKYDTTESHKAAKNYVKNTSCLKNTSGITVSGGSVSQSKNVLGIDNGVECSINSSVLGQTFSFQLKNFDQDLNGRNCGASFLYRGVNAGAYKAYVKINGVKVSEEVQLENTYVESASISTSKEVYLSFICGIFNLLDPPVTREVVIESTSASAGIFAVAKIYAGEAINLFQVSQASHVGTLKYVGTPSCHWDKSTSYGSFSDLDVNTNCPTPVVTGSLLAPSTKIPGFQMNVVAGSIYRITTKASFSNGNGTNITAWRMSDGTDATDICTHSKAQSGLDIGNSAVASCMYKPTTSGLKTIRYQSNQTANISATGIINDNSISDFIIEVEEFPSQSKLVANAIDQDFGPLQISSVPGVLITGATTNPTFGTPTRNKASIEKIGRYLKFHWSFERGSSSGFANGSGSAYFINLPSGYEIDMSDYGLADSFSDSSFSKFVAVKGQMDLGTTQGADLSLSGRLYIYDKTRLFVVTADNGTANMTIWNPSYFEFATGAPDLIFEANFEVPIKGWKKSALSMPVCVGCVGTKSSRSMVFAGANVTNNGSACSVSDTYESGITATYVAGRCQVNFNGAFNGTPICHLSVADISATATNFASVPTSTGVIVNTFNSTNGVPQNTTFTIDCRGPK